MKLQWKKLLATGIAVALCVSGMVVPVDASAAKVKVKAVALNKEKVTLYQGASKAYSSVTLKATIKPKKASKVIWRSSDKKIAVVSAKGVVKAKKAGKAVITAVVGNKSAACKVTVKKIVKKVKKISVTKKSVTLLKGKTANIKVSVLPKKATLRKVSFQSDNKKVATVSSTGKIKGVKAGTARITVSAVDGSKKKTVVKVKVVAGSTPKPTAAPTTEPTIEPTTEPTIEPTTAPTQEPTPVPTVAPTASPSASPSPTPGGSGGVPSVPSGPSGSDATPTPKPFTTEIKGVKDNEDNMTYTLDEETPYLIKGTLAGTEYEVTTGDATIALLHKVLPFVDTDKTITELCESFTNKTMDKVAYQIAEGSVVTVSKNAGENTAKVSVQSTQSGVGGDYILTLQEEKGVCALQCVKNEENYVKADIMKNADGTYAISGIDGKKEGKVLALTAFPDKNATVAVAADEGKTTITCMAGGKQAVFIVSDDGSISLKLPEEYITKYQIKIFK